MIYPKDWVEPEKTGELEITEEKKTEMVAKAKELFSEPIEHKDLADLLEQHYVASHEHYTSTQLKMVVDQVAKDLAPEPKEVVEEKV